MIKEIKKEIKEKENKEKARILQGFFKTGKGQYGEGDIFLGLSVGETRTIAKKHFGIALNELQPLLESKIHEERLCALLILVEKFRKSEEKEKKQIIDFYLNNTKNINNWDLVDLSADKILGEFLFDKNKDVLFKLAKSNKLWEKRISVLSTYAFIKRNRFKETLEISGLLLKDEHDLIQKAIGWMLREIGKRNLKTEEKFLKKHYKKMPRTMLRYAIEKFPETKRKAYLKGKIK
ncbi:MAG: DNA alkylation repair protein [Candidatus Diapherotrites archaeon CG10_big_fil_rev_8_21_14_0_10_31_34]|nr:MAG: DNA alkylation repair protein [Candidatus Diapherotrites archaeon CG10_big_fil_rev_8_21_14_0_10_31_34]PJA16939.1 MAG: DNA alkylation repair protein [Candidatus Diapherotrites archaeon CG_4_10_14_0_2_um_filter_31_5]